ncbi:DUF3027 domain-containing protein [Amycolatopsis rifamycinica]|uniref:DUF3027 domain-containing protein n=1 Tax=Amycolatopsis rifamycinica TaxID=287986 RepID=A0A066U910_9PSEU|nr:DUF3027 domain-containing protein [Amycolatopsis rifamycinica]KDN23585.1 hypothetical protein DV20_03605 [Amycolatopsis rifamycinica]
MTLLLTLDDGSVQRKLADAVEFARAAVLEDAPEEQLGGHVGVTREDAVTASHLFEAQVPGYGGWRWSVTVAVAGEDEPVTVSEVVLVPGPSALVAPAWVPWERRVRAGDLGVGDIFPTAENDPRLAPAYLQSDDPAVEEVAREVGLGRVHTLSRYGRTEAAARWHAGEFGPRSDMARSAPDVCGTCGFFVPLAGSLRGVFGVCSNDIAPADGHVVDVEYGCGAHSEVEVEVTSSIPVAELVYDDSLLDFAPAPETEVSEISEVSPAEVASAAVASEVTEPGEAAAPVTTEPAVGEVAEPEVEAAAVAEPATGEVAEPAVGEVAEPGAEAAAVAEPVTGEVAEPGEVAASVVAEPVRVPEPAASELADSVPALAEPTAAEPEAATLAAADSGAEQAEGAGAPAEALEATGVGEPVAAPEGVEPVEASVVAAGEPVAPEAPEVAEPVVAEVPEPAEAEPTQAEVTDAAALQAPEQHETTADPEAGEIPAAAESDAAEVDPLPVEVADLVAGSPSAGREESSSAEAAELQGAVVPESAEAEPGQAEVAAELEGAGVSEPAEAEAVQGEPVVAEVPESADAEAAQGEPVVAEVPEPAEAEPTQAEVTDAVSASETADGAGALETGQAGSGGDVPPAAVGEGDEAQAQVDGSSER